MRSGWYLLAAMTVFQPACRQDDDTTGPGNGGDSPAIAVAISPASITVPQGGSASATAALTRAGGFAGGITLALENVPAGVTAAVSPTTLPPETGSATITVAVSGTAAAGSFTIRLRATAAGVQEKTATLGLTVTAVTTPGFTLTPAPNALSIRQGAAATSTITVARTGGFTGAVNVSVSSAPAGVNAVIDPPIIIDGTATVTVGAPFNAPTGAYTVTVRGTSAGVADVSVALPVQVTSANPTGGVSWQFCGATGLPVWFAYQDGSGPWTRVTGVNDVYAFDIASARGGVAFVVPVASGFDVAVHYATTTELRTLGAESCGGFAATKSVSGTVAGLGATDQAWITLGGASTITPPISGPGYTLNQVLDGPRDLLASRITVQGNGVRGLDKFILRRGLNPASGSTLPVLDFASAEAFDPVGGSFTLDNLGTDRTFVVAAYYTTLGLASPYFADAVDVAGNVRTFPGVPASRQVGGDLHVVTVIASGAAADMTRTATHVFREAGPKNVSLAPALGPVTVTVPSSQPYARPRAQYSIQASYNTYWTFGLAQSGAASRRASISVTAAWLGTANTIDLILPDFSSTAGWDSSWGPRAGVSAAWSFSASGWLAAGGLQRPPFQEGVTGVSAARTGQITP